MKSMKTRIGIAAAACVAGLAITPAAHANSFTQAVPGGSASYYDGTDTFCVRAGVNRFVSAKVTPVSRSGPSFSLTAEPGRASACSTALKRAYEDTRYKAVIRGGGKTKVVYFWS